MDRKLTSSAPGNPPPPSPSSLRAIGISAALAAAVCLASADPAAAERPVLRIEAGPHVMTAVFAENASAQALQELLREGALTLGMHDFARMEKAGTLPRSLPACDIDMHAAPGDIILYQGRTIALYYGRNTWQLTPLARIEGVTEEQLRHILGDGNIALSFSLAERPEQGR